MHSAPIRLLKFNANLDLVISADDKGVIEIWDPETFDFPSDEKRLLFELMSETDYYELPKNKTCGLSCAFNSKGNLLAIFCRDRKIRIFNFRTGKLIKVYNETLETYIE